MLKFYNTLTQKKENFIPIKSGEVKIYACGPTVYNYIHIGNARPMCTFDVLRRFLEYTGNKVTYVQNFTDIDDKIINKAISENTDFSNVSKKYIEEYKKDASGLNIKEATYHPKATENINEIIKSIELIIEKGFAYSVSNGDVYFRTRKFENYGKLSKQTIDDLQSGARIRVDDSKEDPLDFALWKSVKPGEPSWESPWGNGRPGWHIECTAMAQKYLGETIDIHCGGQDLIFPHHENEIAQSECMTGKKFANYWLHNGYINVDNQKMSKSLNNFFTVREISEKYGYEAIRYLMLASHYRSPINFSEDIIIQCTTALQRLYNFKENLLFALENSKNENSEKYDSKLKLEEYTLKFIEAMNDDLNTADALGVIFEFVKDVNSNILASQNYDKITLENIIRVFNEFMDVLGLLYEKDSKKSNTDNSEIEELIKLRENARKEKNWKLADEIRDKLNNLGVLIEDTPQGTKFNFK